MYVYSDMSVSCRFKKQNIETNDLSKMTCCHANVGTNMVYIYTYSYQEK